jgi:cell division septation protein DedD
VSIPTPQEPDAAPDRFDKIDLLEFDENVPPRPEEEVADAARAVPDRRGHGDPGPGSTPDSRPDSPADDAGPRTA